MEVVEQVLITRISMNRFDVSSGDSQVFVYYLDQWYDCIGGTRGSTKNGFFFDIQLFVIYPDTEPLTLQSDLILR